MLLYFDWNRFLLFVTLFVTLTGRVHSQPTLEFNVAGSNFEGITFNTGYLFPLSQDSMHHLHASMGIGGNVLYAAGALGIVQGTLRYSFRKLGIGIESSVFMDNPLTSRYYFDPKPSVTLFPNLNYSIKVKRNIYLRPSAGFNLLFKRGPKTPFRGKYPLKLDAPVQPTIGISISKRL